MGYEFKCLGEAQQKHTNEAIGTILTTIQTVVENNRILEGNRGTISQGIPHTVSQLQLNIETTLDQDSQLFI